LCAQRCSSAYLKWLFELLLPFYKLELVWPFSSVLWHEQSIFTHITGKTGKMPVKQRNSQTQNFTIFSYTRKERERRSSSGKEISTPKRRPAAKEQVLSVLHNGHCWLLVENQQPLRGNWMLLTTWQREEDLFFSFLCQTKQSKRIHCWLKMPLIPVMIIKMIS